MVKSELIDKIAKNSMQLGRADIESTVNKVIDMMSETLEQGGRIEVRGFGSFVFITGRLVKHITLKPANV